MERGPAQAVLPLVGLAAEKVIRDQHKTRIMHSHKSNLIFQAVGCPRVESGPAQAVLPLVGLAADQVIGDQHKVSTPSGITDANRPRGTFRPERAAPRYRWWSGSWFVCLAVILSFALPVFGVEQVSFQRDGRQQYVAGKLLVEDQEGGVLLLSPDRTLWVIPQEEIIRRDHDDAPYRPLTDTEMTEQLLDELPDGFHVHDTAHYLIFYNTSPAYARWCGSLYERLHRGFHNYWNNRGFPLREPEQRLVALVFDRRRSFQEYAEPELGESAASMIGYYNMRTNRVTMYDLTGIDGLRGRRGRSGTTGAHINHILSQPAAERTVATIVHEATHQLAYNSGLQTRYADNPTWVSEGIAVFFETPDLGSSRGWRSIGGVHPLYLPKFLRSLATRDDDPLTTLLNDDARFRDPKTSSQAYADAWALNYYLLRVRHEDYVEYLQELANQKPLVEQDTKQRIARFRRAFGDDLQQLSRKWLRYMQGVR
ncbi:MAG: DUF1570 domain-containing protein [Planctomycetota bacterium]